LLIASWKYKLQYSNPFWNEDRSSNCGQVAAKTAFYSVNTEIIVHKFTEFIHNLAGFLLFDLLKAASGSANPLLNARAKSKGRSW